MPISKLTMKSAPPAAHLELSGYIRAKVEEGRRLADWVEQVWLGNVEGMQDAKSRRWAVDWLTQRGMGRVPHEIRVAPARQMASLDDRPLTMEQLAALAQLDPGAPRLQLVPLTVSSTPLDVGGNDGDSDT